MVMTKSQFFVISLVLLNILACGKNTSNIEESTSVSATEEVGQQVADVLASVDEADGAAIAPISFLKMDQYEKTFKRYTQEKTPSLNIGFLPKATAATCSSVSISACSASAKSRTFSNCDLATGSTLNGSVQFSFSGNGAATCTLDSNGDYVNRSPNFTITNSRGAEFEVTVPSGSTGQRLTKTGATSFSFSNTGVRRKFTSARGVTLVDTTTSTSSPLTLTGTSRSDRTLTGGTLVVTNNLNSETCSLTPVHDPHLIRTPNPGGQNGSHNV
ncbi:MAG: hypothetical protein ACLGGX_12370 [Bdellovibrionia bacterium]